MNEYVTEDPWLITYQIAWESQIFNTDLPLWLRVYAVAMARCSPNLHTPLQTGELAKLLGKPQEDGTLKIIDRSNLAKSIAAAIEYGFLDSSSSAACLVLPAKAVDCRLPCSKKPCPHCTHQSSKPRRPIILKKPVSQERTALPFIDIKRNDASSLVEASAVVPQTPQRGTSDTTLLTRHATPGSRDVFGTHIRERQYA